MPWALAPAGCHPKPPGPFAPAARAVLMPRPRALFPALPRRTRDRLLFSRSSNGESSERTNLLQKRTASLLSAPLTPALLPRGRAHPPAISCHTEDRDRIWSTALPQSLRQCLALNETVERMKKKKSPITASESPFQLFHICRP